MIKCTRREALLGSAAFVGAYSLAVVARSAPQLPMFDAEHLPRDQGRMDGHNFRIVGIDGTRVTITDGERTAIYAPSKAHLLDMRDVAVKPSYIEAGAFCEANVVILTDGTREAIYVPVSHP